MPLDLRGLPREKTFWKRDNKGRYSKERYYQKLKEWLEAKGIFYFREKDKWDIPLEIDLLLNYYYLGIPWYSPKGDHDMVRRLGRSFRSVETELWKLGNNYRDVQSYRPGPKRIFRFSLTFPMRYDEIMLKRECAPKGILHGAHVPARIAQIHAWTPSQALQIMEHRIETPPATLTPVRRRKGETVDDFRARLVFATIPLKERGLFDCVEGDF